MFKLTNEQREKIRALSNEFIVKYLKTSQGKKHLEAYKKEKEEVKKVFTEIKEKKKQGKDITDDILYKLLPYSNTQYNRRQDHRISTWPAITKDVKKWFEAAGWQKSENWPEVAIKIFNLINELLNGGGQNQILKFVNSEYSKGFQSGIISPILYCLNCDFLPINNKTVDTVNFILQEQIIDSRLENYLQNVEKIKLLIKELGIKIFEESYENFDAFCHWMCDKRLGGYARIRKEEIDIEPPIPEIETHEEAIGKLLEIGKWLGFDRYVGRVEAGKKYQNKKLHDFANLRDVPEDFKSIKDIRMIDVIWYNKHSPPSFIFEVDFKGNIRSALRKLYQARNLNAKFFIVSPIQNKEKLEKELSRDPYRAFRKMFKFISFEDLAKLYESAYLFFRNKKELLDI